MWDVAFDNQALRFLKRADKILLGRIAEKIEEIRENQIISGAGRIQGYAGLWGFASVTTGYSTG